MGPHRCRPYVDWLPNQGSNQDLGLRNPLVDNLSGLTAPFENAPSPYRRSSWPQLAHQASLS
jgi:hypothetical protein